MGKDSKYILKCTYNGTIFAYGQSGSGKSEEAQTAKAMFDHNRMKALGPQIAGSEMELSSLPICSGVDVARDGR